MPLGHRPPAYKCITATKLRICEANTNKLITDRHMKISNNGGREQNNVMFIDALQSINTKYSTKCKTEIRKTEK